MQIVLQLFRIVKCVSFSGIFKEMTGRKKTTLLQDMWVFLCLCIVCVFCVCMWTILSFCHSQRAKNEYNCFNCILLFANDCQFNDANHLPYAKLHTNKGNSHNFFFNLISAENSVVWFWYFLLLSEFIVSQFQISLGYLLMCNF